MYTFIPVEAVDKLHGICTI